jgi:spermidine/putrescine transport system permease protein
MAPGKTSSIFLRLHAALVYLFLYAPIAVLVLYSFNRSVQTAQWKGFTTQWYAVALKSDDLTEAALNSLLVAAATTAVAAVIGTMAALGLHRLASRRRDRKFSSGSMTRALLFLPIVIPEIVIGAALLTFILSLGWQRGFWTVVAAHVSFSVSYVAIIVRARLAGFDPALEEAARDLGASAAGVFWRVKLPLILPGIVAAALLVFTLSIDDYVITAFTSGAGIKMLPLEIYARLKVSAKPEVNAISTMLLVFTIALIAIAQWLIRDRRAKGERR